MELSAVSPVILGFLADRPRSGYEIKKAVDRSTRFFWAASYGQIYPELRRLDRAGLVRGESRPSGGRARRVYELTPAGADALRGWLRGAEGGCEMRDLSLLKLFFAGALPPREAIDRVRAMRADRERTLAALRAVEASAGPAGMPALVLEYGIALHEWSVDWCRRVEERLAAALDGDHARHAQER
jgi:DNA-binding PadR family transcriptional regulator